jgi:diaminopimelate epimerase
MTPDTFVITAAGGNPTAIQLIDGPRERSWYEQEGQALMERLRRFRPEQVGFLEPNSRHFEMGGGEFCGNAARSAAVVLSIFQTCFSQFEFTMSGYNGPVQADVTVLDVDNFSVSCVFQNMEAVARPVRLHDEVDAQIVDLGGIVHVLIEGALPADYESRHRAITTELGLTERAAVGVNWIVREGDRVTLHPVVWVRAVDTFFYETACGSGSIAAAAATNVSEIVQPTGQSIGVEIGPNGVRLSSRMEVIHAA